MSHAQRWDASLQDLAPYSRGGRFVWNFHVCLSLRRLCAHSDDQLPEVASLKHADEGFGRVLETVDEILAIADAAIRDTGIDFAQECGIVFGGEFVVNEAAQCQALRQDLAHGGGEPIGTIAFSYSVVLRDQAGHRDTRKLVEQR